MDFYTEFLTSFSPSTVGFLFMWVLAGVALFAFVIIVERWWDIARRTDVNAPLLVPSVITYVDEKRLQDAYRLCAAGGRRALPRVMGAGIHRAMSSPPLIKSSMEEEMLHMVPILERRLPVLAACGNIATLIGLMGTIYGLILAFAAVGQPGVAAAEKASMLATGISAAMNTTLLGLVIAVPCVTVYALLRSKVDKAVTEIDRYCVSLLKALLPADSTQKNYKVSGRRIKEEVDTEPNIIPFMNLMVVLIPLLLSSSEFVKLGMVEMKLPESSGGGAGEDQQTEEIKLNLGVIITGRGFSTFHYFNTDKSPKPVPAQVASEPPLPEIPKVGTEYDFKTLGSRLTEVKRRALVAVIKTTEPSFPENAPLAQAWEKYRSADYRGARVFADIEDLKIVAEDSVRYQVVVSVMDAARSARLDGGNVALFPNVSIAGGIAY